MSNLFKLLLFTSPVLRSWNENEAAFAKTKEQKQKYIDRTAKAEEKLKEIEKKEKEKEKKSEEFQKEFEKAMKKWVYGILSVIGVLVWVGFLEFHEAYIDVPLRSRISIYAIHMVGLFYGMREILTRDDWEPYHGLSLSHIFPDNKSYSYL